LKNFYSHGKLLLTGEYVVLDDALALAVPTRFGQSLDIDTYEPRKIKWTSLDENNSIWFQTEFKFQNNEILKLVQNDDSISNKLLQILKAAKELNPEFLNDDKGYNITTKLEFLKNWGLGTSSTLIHNIADWARINPYQLLEKTFGGSGYDIACAKAHGPLTYQLNKNSSDETLKLVQGDEQRSIKTVDFNPTFKDQLYFIHLNQKQNSRDGIAQYRNNTSNLSALISRISTITKNMVVCDALDVFQKLMDEHEELISEIIKQTPVKARLFADFKGSIKSLGAWGGDFVMVASEDNPTVYFKDKGYPTILSYTEMVKN